MNGTQADTSFQELCHQEKRRALLTAPSILFISFYLYTRLPHTPHSPFSISLCCPTCSKNGLFTSALPPISWPEVEEVEEVANPTHLTQPIRAGLGGGTVDHVTLLYWVSVFLISSERSCQFPAKLWPTVSAKIKSSQEFRSRKPKEQQRNLSIYYFKTTAKSKVQHNSFMDRRRQRESVYVHKHTLFSAAQCRTATLCFGTTQDIPAGFYQPKFQDTTSLSHR